MGAFAVSERERWPFETKMGKRFAPRANRSSGSTEAFAAGSVIFNSSTENASRKPQPPAQSAKRLPRRDVRATVDWKATIRACPLQNALSLLYGVSQRSYTILLAFLTGRAARFADRSTQAKQQAASRDERGRVPPSKRTDQSLTRRCCSLLLFLETRSPSLRAVVRVLRTEFYRGEIPCLTLLNIRSFQAGQTARCT